MFGNWLSFGHGGWGKCFAYSLITGRGLSGLVLIRAFVDDNSVL
jgi:hypothetical protein